jgi:adenylate kinase
MLEPSKYTMNVEPTPLDLTLKPTAVVMGLPKSGKTTLAASLAKNVGMIHLDPASIVEMFIDRDCYSCNSLSLRIRNQGKEMDDASMVDLIARRVNMKDCIQNGWVLDGYPHTR